MDALSPVAPSGLECLLPFVCKRELLERLLWHLGTGAGTAHVRLDLLWVEGSWGWGTG